MEASMPGADSSAGGPGARLRELGVALPAAPKPLGNYVEVAQVGSLLFVSGTLPLANGKLAVTGRIGESLSVAQGQEAARLAALNALAAVQAHVGDLNRVKRLVRLTLQLAATEKFTDHAAVADGASDLFAQVFGAGNGHTRVVYGVQSLPKGTPVVTETIFETA
jgi:enamine deaminase RidA (YjgF/YER057c/UK114 family)